MIDLLSAVTSMLAGGGFGTVGQDLFSAALPDNPPSCTAVVQTGGQANSGEPTRTPEITILHRARDVHSATTRITSINAFVLSNNGFRCLGEITGRFVAGGEPSVAGYDRRNLIVYQVKYTFVTTKQL